MHRTLACALAIALVACASSKPAQKPFELAAAPAGTLTVGLIVSSGTATAQEQADAMARFVGTAVGKPARAAVFPDYDTLAAYFSEGKVDVGFLPPMAYVRATSLGKAVPLAKVVRFGQSTYRSVLFSAAGSPLKSLDDLKKAHELKVAWVDPSSATGYIFAKALLVQNGINPGGLFRDQAFLTSHDEVCRAVAQGKANLGASYSIDPTTAPVKVITGCAALGADAAKLQVVAATEGIPNDVLAVRDGFSEDSKTALLAAAQALDKTDDGKKVLTTAFHADGFTTVADEDYAPVRAALNVFKH
jgi:phosphonate transport system substrate-binding protein